MKRLKKKTITVRTVIYLIAIIILSDVVVFSVSYTIMRKRAAKQTTEIAKNLITSNLATVEQYFDEINKIANAVIYNSKVVDYISGNPDNKNEDSVYSILDIYYSSRPDLNLSLYREGDYTTKYSISRKEQNNHIGDYRQEMWYRKLSDEKSKKVILTNYTDTEGERFKQVIVYKINDRYSEKTVGYFCVDLDLEMLKEQILNSSRTVDRITITDSSGDKVFSEGEAITLPDKAYRSVESGSYENSDAIIMWNTEKTTQWRIALAVSKAGVKRDNRMLILLLLLLLSGITAITVIASRRQLLILTRNYDRLMDGMEQVKTGNLAARVEKSEVEDEIGSLIEEFNLMMSKINLLMKEVESKQILLKEAEIKALQQQINPHFIHNSMQTIIGLICEDMDRQAIRVCQSLSSMLRYNMRFENITDLKSEIEQAQNYIQIMKVRFEDSFEPVYDLDEACFGLKMVKFTLQPLIENAISHGFQDTESGGILKIRVKKRKNDVNIVIFDNGTGIEKEKKEELKQRLEITTENPLQYIEQYKSLGLLNVHLRLKLYYGEGYSMRLYSKWKKGTCISIRIPLKEGVEQDV